MAAKSLAQRENESAVNRSPEITTKVSSIVPGHASAAAPRGEEPAKLNLINSCRRPGSLEC